MDDNGREAPGNQFRYDFPGLLIDLDFSLVKLSLSLPYHDSPEAMQNSCKIVTQTRKGKNRDHRLDGPALWAGLYVYVNHHSTTTVNVIVTIIHTIAVTDTDSVDDSVNDSDT